MSTNENPSPIMSSPVFRYAILVVLSVVAILGGGLYYRTHAYRYRHHPHGPRDTEAALVVPSVARDWGPKPKLFDVYLDEAREKPEADWDEITPISVTRGVLDASGASSLARVTIMIRMPLPKPTMVREPLTDDENPLPPLEIGQSDVNVPLKDVKALSSSFEDGEKGS
ncbi:hypothetical protein K438DRAFT_1943465 [Mycena galopus ATCC 62051]|nr:hypothetical protein K438DRAFT_1943465 [Mycena galopus ATCC 62051]